MSRHLLLIGTLVSLAGAQDWDADVLRKLKVIEAAADKQVPAIRIDALLDAAAQVKDTHRAVSQSLAAKALAAWRENPGVLPTGRIAGRLFRLQGPSADQIVLATQDPAVAYNVLAFELRQRGGDGAGREYVRKGVGHHQVFAAIPALRATARRDPKTALALFQEAVEVFPWEAPTSGQLLWLRNCADAIAAVDREAAAKVRERIAGLLKAGAETPGVEAQVRDLTQQLNHPKLAPGEADDVIRTAISLVKSAPAGVDHFEAANALSGTAADFPVSAELRAAAAKILMDSLSSLISQEAEVVQEYRRRGQAGLSLNAAGTLSWVAFGFPGYKHRGALAEALELHQELLSLTNLLNQRISFEITGLGGEKRKSADYRGKVVLLNFWATWCPPCRREMPTLEKLHREREKEGLVVLALTDEDSAVVSKFVVQGSYSMPIVLDPGGKVHDRFSRRGIPHTIIIGRDGRILEQFYGMRSEEEYLRSLRAAGL
jgi:thiol-disulfide isomerase/thioredoxin